VFVRTHVSAIANVGSRPVIPDWGASSALFFGILGAAHRSSKGLSIGAQIIGAWLDDRTSIHLRG
jgi:hypothetical protein